MEPSTDRRTAMWRRTTIALAALMLATTAAAAVAWGLGAGPGGAPVRIDGYRGAEHRLTVSFTTGIGDRITEVRFDERPDTVVVTVRLHHDDRPHEALGLPYEITATLYEPLGTRRVLDGSSGSPVPPAG